MRTVKEVSRISGVSVRTLHHYDAIGLLKPTKVTEAGYRLYDEEALRRLQTILMFRELGFALADIKKILDSPDFSLKEALCRHIDMLKLQRERIDRLIENANEMLKGENADFSAFDRSEMDKYAKEVKERWGSTDAYRESVEKLKGRTDKEMRNMEEGLTERFAEFGRIRKMPADSDEAQDAVRKLQDYITDNFYRCTREILAGLGEMYISDGRFRDNIDKAGGEGTADFVGRAIKIYCR